MDNQQKNNFNEKEQNIDGKYSRSDLEFLRQIGEIAREFQTVVIKDQNSVERHYFYLIKLVCFID